MTHTEAQLIIEIFRLLVNRAHSQMRKPVYFAVSLGLMEQLKEAVFGNLPETTASRQMNGVDWHIKAIEFVGGRFKADSSLSEGEYRMLADDQWFAFVDGKWEFERLSDAAKIRIGRIISELEPITDAENTN